MTQTDENIGYRFKKNMARVSHEPEYSTAMLGSWMVSNVLHVVEEDAQMQCICSHGLRKYYRAAHVRNDLVISLDMACYRHFFDLNGKSSIATDPYDAGGIFTDNGLGYINEDIMEVARRRGAIEADDIRFECMQQQRARRAHAEKRATESARREEELLAVEEKAAMRKMEAEERLAAEAAEDARREAEREANAKRRAVEALAKAEADARLVVQYQRQALAEAARKERGAWWSAAEKARKAALSDSTVAARATRAEKDAKAIAFARRGARRPPIRADPGHIEGQFAMFLEKRPYVSRANAAMEERRKSTRRRRTSILFP
jgi:hypothetical protein